MNVTFPCWECVMWAATNEDGSKFVLAIDSSFSEFDAQRIFQAFVESFHARDHRKLEVF